MCAARSAESLALLWHIGGLDSMLWALGSHGRAYMGGSDVSHFASLSDHSGEQRGRGRGRWTLLEGTGNHESFGKPVFNREGSRDQRGQCSRGREDAERNQVCNTIAEPLEVLHLRPALFPNSPALRHCKLD